MPAHSRHLPPRPSLEQQQKQAKDLLAAFRTGDADAHVRIRDVLPDKPRITLADAQLTIAREYGFRRWADLVAYIRRLRGSAGDTNPPSPAAELRSTIALRDPEALRDLLRRRPEARAHINDPLFSFGSPAIIQAASWGNIALIDALLEEGADPNRRSDWWAGPFHALHSATGAAAERLLAAGAVPDMCAAANLDRPDLVRAADRARVHERGGDGQTPLHFARSRAMIDLLLELGADIDARDLDHRATPAEWMLDGRRELARYLVVDRGASADIFMAAALGLTDRLETLLRDDPSLIAVRTGAGSYGEHPPSSFHIYTWSIGQDFSPLRTALKFRQKAAAALLLDHLARDPAELTAELFGAAMSGSAELARALLERGADPNVRDESDHASPLHYAAENGHLDVVRALVEAGADIDGDGDDHLIGVLGWATCLGRVQRNVAAYLLQRGARLDIFPAISLGRPADVRTLIEHDPALLDTRMNSGDMDLRTPLHHAVEAGSVAIVTLLLEAGADPNARNRFGQKPAAYARSGPAQREILELLLARGAEPDDLLTLLLLRRFQDAEALLERDPGALTSPDDRPTPLHHAVARGDLDSAAWLIERGAELDDIRTVGSCGVTPLHVAAAENLPELARLLLDAGADTTIRDTRWNADPLGWAEYLGSHGVREVLAQV